MKLRFKVLVEGEWHIMTWSEIHDAIEFGNTISENMIRQSTGLYDRNGNEIFFGDILSVCNGSINGQPWMQGPYDVDYRYNKGFGMPMFCWNKDGESIMDSTHWCEVIGNKHDNPELINNN